MIYTLNLEEINMTRIKDVGCKNASLGEMYQNLTHQGVRVPIQIHPMAWVHFDQLQDQEAKSKIESLTRHKECYFVGQLSQAVATIAAAFHPKDVIVRMSDFKSNEYANLIGGNAYEPKEENPMLGFRGASRYYNKRYRKGFKLECEAMKVVRDEMGLTNVKLMIPFCRTMEEGRQVVNVMNDYGPKQGKKWASHLGDDRNPR